jgi:hypothetical protein
VREAISWAIAGFVVVKCLFSFLGWLTRDGLDLLYRKQLDAIFDAVSNMSLFELLHVLLGRFVRRVKETFSTRGCAFRRFAMISLLVNVAAILAGAEVFEWFAGVWPDRVYELERATRQVATPYFLGKGTLVMLFPGWTPYGPAEPVFDSLSAIPLGMLFNFCSLLLSWALLKRATRARSTTVTLVHLGINVLVLALGFFWVNLIYGPIYYVTPRIFGGSAGDLPSASQAARFVVFNSITFVHIVFRFLHHTLPENLTQFETRGIFLGLCAAAPTIVYLFVSMVAVGARLAPKWLQIVITRLVYLVTTDKEPVFAQLGNVVGAVVALITAISQARYR